MATLKYLGVIYGYSTIIKRAERLGMPRRLRKGRRYFTQYEAKKLSEFKRSIDKNDPVKILVIEAYEKGFSREDICMAFNLSKTFVRTSIGRYNKTGFAIVNSKLNLK